MSSEIRSIPASVQPLDARISPFVFDNTYARDLTGLYAPASPSQAPAPRLIKVNHALAAELGVDGAALESAEGVAILSGNAMPNGASPIAQAYAGHQFGGFSPQLGDGRALLLGEVIDRHGMRQIGRAHV